MEENKKPRKPRQKKVKMEGVGQRPDLPSFHCPNCDLEMFMDIQTGEHVYDHVMTCSNCFDRMTNHVFNRFIQLGVGMNTSFIRQAVKYMDEFFHIKMQEDGEVDE